MNQISKIANPIVVGAIAYAAVIAGAFAILDWVIGDWTHGIGTVFVVAAFGYWSGRHSAPSAVSSIPVGNPGGGVSGEISASPDGTAVRADKNREWEREAVEAHQADPRFESEHRTDGHKPR